MCGIVGFTGERNQELLKRMADTIFHRGPDQGGFYSDGSVNLGIRRLCIVDVESGKQPMCNEDGSIWVVFNGEIYNHGELRKKLEDKGHVFRTDHSDTEVIVHLYEEYGEYWPRHVNGMFGLAIWDSRKDLLMLYRDRIGKKPLYYAELNGQLVFSSEIKALLKHPGISSEPDYQALYHYFGLKHISAPRTAFEQIKQLLPGHLLKWTVDGITAKSYWKVDFGSPLTDITEEEASEHLLYLLEDAVKIRMQCDVPFGAYLSGGVDSTSVVALMRKHHYNPVITFCLGYRDRAEGQFYGKYQDLYYARMMAQRLKTAHYEEIISARDFAEGMPEVIRAFDEPFSGTVSTYYLSSLVKRHVKVALSGDGADELFGSYLAHRLAFPIERYLELTKNRKTAWEDLNEDEKRELFPFNTPEQFSFLQRIASRSLAEWRERLSVFSHAERKNLLSREFLEAAGWPEENSVYACLEKDLTANDALNRVLEMDQKELLPNQVLPFVDRLSMAHSVEVRCPYLDYRIVEFANSLPGELKIKNKTVKYIQKKAMKRVLPQELLERPKEGFVQPIYTWMHGSLRKWVEDKLDSLPREIFNLKYVENLKREFQSGKQYLNAKIWNLVCFNIWFEGNNRK